MGITLVSGEGVASDSPAVRDSVVSTPATNTSPPPAPVPVSRSAPAPMQIPAGAKLYVEASDFGMALSAAILKKKVPVVSMTDSTKSDFFVHTTSNATTEKTGVRIVKILAFGAGAGSGNHFNATVTITNLDGVIVFAHSSKKENFQSAAQNVAKKLKQHIEEQR
jgi:hypothetical protein